MAKEEQTYSKLSWIRIFDPTHIPAYLIYQIKERDFTTDQFYLYQKLVCTQIEGDQLVINPFNLLYLIVDEEKSAMGFLWCVVDILNGYLCINNFSMDKRYWGKGRAVEFLKDKCQEILRGSKLKKIFWCTKHTKYAEKYGFEQSKSKLMEYSEIEVQNGNNDESKSNGEYSTEQESSSVQPGDGPSV